MADPRFPRWKGGGQLLILELKPIISRPQRSCEGYVFTPVCHSVHRGGVCLSACWDHVPPRTRHTPPGTMHPPRTICPPWDHAPPGTMHPPRTMHPQDQAHPPGPGTPRDQAPPGTMHPPRTRHTAQDHAPPQGQGTPSPRTMHPPGTRHTPP